MWKTKLIEAILNYKRPLLVILTLMTLAGAFFSLRLEFDGSIDIWFLENDPNLVKYHEFLDRFGADEVLVLGVFGENLFDRASLDHLNRITDQVAKAPFAHRVRSLSNIKIIDSIADNIEISPLLKELPSSTTESQQLREKALAIPLLKGMLSRDGKATAVLIELQPEGNSFDGKVALVSGVRKILQQEQGPLTVKLAGSPYIDEAIFLNSKKDSTLLGPLTVLLVIVIIYVLFRNWHATWIPLVVISGSLAWLFGLMGFLGIKMNLISSSLAVVVTAVGVADTVHVLSAFYQKLGQGLERKQAIITSFVDLITPCLLTTLTTASGMLSLLVSQLKPIREFGWLAALGVCFAFAISLTLVPILLEKIPVKAKQKMETAWLDRWISKLSTPFASRPIIIASLVFLGVSFWGIFNITVGANVMNYFKPSDPVRTNHHLIENQLTGSGSVEFFIETFEDGLKKPSYLKELDDFQNWMADIEGVTHSLSVVDSLKEVDRVFLNSKGSGQIPESSPVIAQYYFILEGNDDIDSLVQDNYSIARISTRVKISAAEEVVAKVKLINQKLAQLNSDNFKVTMTGFIKLMNDMDMYLIRSQILSLSMAFIVITLMMMLLLRSVKLGLFSMIPNYLPIVGGLGLMGLSGIDLDPGTVMIGSLTLGLVVDDSVHFLVRLRENLNASGDIKQAIHTSINQTGRPIIITSIVLSLALLILLIASFTPIIYFGFIASVVIMLALIADLIVLPAILTLFFRK